MAGQLGVFRARDFVERGFPRETLRRLVAKGAVQQLGRGLYASAGFDGDQHLSLLEAAKRYPRGVVCLASALRFHEIGTQSPFRVWLALPRGANVPEGPGLPIRFCKFAPSAHAYGVEQHAVSGGLVRVYSVAKTVADCFKFRNRYGLDMAVEALRDGWREKKFTLTELAEAATVCRIGKVLQPYLQMLS